ncbi:MAG: hypothetical protein ABSD29_14860 [Verrucomicrobiota bacterium]|jgi:hypothetical protein
MKSSNTRRSFAQHPFEIRLDGSNLLFRAPLAAVVFACLLLGTNLAPAQAPVNQLHFAFTDAPGTTTTTSDTTLNAGAITATLTMYNPAGTAAVDLHGAVGSGVNGVATGIRAMDFTSDLTASQGTTQPANNSGNAVVAVDLGDAALASLGNSGVITSFVATIWMKQVALVPANIGPRVWILNAGSAGVDAGGSANTLSLKFQGNNQLYFQFGADTVTVGPAVASPFPTNKWLFFAIVYDGTNASQYYGNDGAQAQLLGTAISAGRSITLGSSACLAIGNRHIATANIRGFNGWFNDFRFYNGAPSTANALAFVESIRASIAPKLPTITGIYPDGTALMQATNELVFNAISSSGLNLTNIGLKLNNVPVSAGSMQFVTNGTAGTSTNVSVSYTGLPQQTTIAAVMTATDGLGLVGAATVTFDTFSPANFIVKAEEFDFNGGQFIDNPDYTDGNPADANSYYGLASIELTDTHKGVGTGDNAGDYRDDSNTPAGYETQTPPATGELPMPLKYYTNLDGSLNPILNHMIGNWSSAEWQNYTKTFPAGNYNVYARLSTSSGSTIRFDQVTGGRGTPNQTTANLGTFTLSGSSLASFQWVPLLKNGTLAVLNLAGVNTVRATSGGGANADLYMLVPANGNLPVISSVYPDGQFLFEATNKLVFTASSAVTTISTNNITVTLNTSNVSAGLVFSGGPSTWNVSYTGLQFNQTYATVIQVTDDNGGHATATLTIDTWNPVFQVEAEDFDFDPALSPIAGTGRRYIDNAVPTAPHVVAANSYEDQVGDSLIDEAGPNPALPITSQPGYSLTNYRTNDYTATTIVTDAARRQFAQANALDYNVGFLGPNFWQGYTRTWPSGTFNLYGRMASGANIGTIHSSWQNIIAGWGTTNQVARTVGTFAIPTTGGYSAYLYEPLIDRFGNYAQLTLGGTNTFRALDLTDAGSYGLNINFYMLLAARNDLPRIDNVYPDGSVLLQQTNTLSFVASSSTYGINTNNIQVTLNTTNISSNLAFVGSSASWNVSYPGLQPNKAYTAVITITDNNNQTHTTTVNFDTFSPNYYTWEAEDFDFDPTQSPVPNGSGLRYIDNPVPTSAPATNSYFGQTGDLGIDESPDFLNVLPAIGVYRGSGDFVNIEVTSDAARQKYQNAQLQNVNPYINDHDVDYFTNWLNYTRTLPTGNFLLYARLSAGNGAFNMTCAQVTSGFGTSVQASNVLGNFVGTGASFATWQYVPLVNTNTGLSVILSLGGVETLQMIGDLNENANFFMLVPVAGPTITASISGTNILVSFATQTGFSYTVYYKNNLRDLSWTQLGSSVLGDGTVKSVPDGIINGSSRFYRLVVQ